MTEVHLGYEVGTGEAVTIPIRNMVVTGQTQEAGKTTTLEGLTARAQMPAIAFKTKRFENSFDQAPRIPPYFRDRADWQFVASILEATMKERMKFERGWIMRASKGAQTLDDVQRNVQKLMAKATGLSADVYFQLNEYLKLVIPQVSQLEHASIAEQDLVWLERRPYLHVMDLDDLSTEVQSLVIRSVLEWVYKHATGVLVVIPEAWEFCPQGRGSPVKLAAIELVRKGSAGKNYIWLDTQDIGGVEKELLRSCPVWLLGVQRERNEVKRTIEQIPGPVKPHIADVMTLELGQFWACHGRVLKKVYAQPKNMSDDQAQRISTGAPKPDWNKVLRALDRIPVQSPDHVNEGVGPLMPHPFPKSAETLKAMINENEDAMWKEKYDALLKDYEELKAQIAELKRAANSVVSGGSGDVRDTFSTKDALREKIREDPVAAMNDRTYRSFVERLRQDPDVLAMIAMQPALEITIERPKIEVKADTLLGRIVTLLSEGYFKEAPRNGNTVYVELKERRRFAVAKPNVYRECDKLAQMGYLVLEDGGYKQTDLKVNVRHV